MQHDDQYMKRTQDLVAEIRTKRQAAEKEMNRFTRVADYDVRRVVGQKQKPSPISGETNSHTKTSAKSAITEPSMEFAPTPEECSGEDL